MWLLIYRLSRFFKFNSECYSVLVGMCKKNKDSDKKTHKALHLTMITTYGVKEGKYSNRVQSQVTLDDLFA